MFTQSGWVGKVCLVRCLVTQTRISVVHEAGTCCSGPGRRRNHARQDLSQRLSLPVAVDSNEGPPHVLCYNKAQTRVSEGSLSLRNLK
jgi:hypothetical protein